MGDIFDNAPAGYMEFDLLKKIPKKRYPAKKNKFIKMKTGSCTLEVDFLDSGNPDQMTRLAMMFDQITNSITQYLDWAKREEMKVSHTQTKKNG